MEYRISVCEMAPQTMLSLPWALHPDRRGADMTAGMRELTAVANRAGLVTCGAPGSTYRRDAESEGSIEIDLAVPVDLGTKLGVWSGAEVIALPGSLVARTCHRGEYDRLDTAFRALREWMRQAGYQSAGPPTEVYLIGPDEVTDPRRLFTEIRIPIARIPVITARTDDAFAQTVQHTRRALERQGFHVAAETDLRAVLRSRLGERIDDYLVLHAWHPALTSRALAADPQAAWLISATVTVRADGAGTLVEARDPTVFPHAVEGTALPDLAGLLRRPLVAALDTLNPPVR